MITRPPNVAICRPIDGLADDLQWGDGAESLIPFDGEAAAEWGTLVAGLGSPGLRDHLRLKCTEPWGVGAQLPGDKSARHPGGGGLHPGRPFHP
ncbi:hypothetical protein GCM10018965_031400 [Nonomuraea roseola]